MATPEKLSPANKEFVDLTLRAIDVASAAAADGAEALSGGRSDLLDRIAKAEQELDEIDHDIDERVSVVVTKVSAEDARELLACMKFAIDLERIGDLLAGFAGQVRILGPDVDAESKQHLVHMARALQRMLEEVRCAFETRDVKCAVNVLRADGEIDRLRNLIFFRYAEQQQRGAKPDVIRLVFMSHALERAGDHAKNLAEEVIHFITGHSVRHVLYSQKKSWEQMYIDFMRAKATRQA